MDAVRLIDQELGWSDFAEILPGQWRARRGRRRFSGTQLAFGPGPTRADDERRVKKGTDRNFGSICCRRRLRPRLIPRKRQGPTVDGEEQE